MPLLLQINSFDQSGKEGKPGESVQPGGLDENEPKMAAPGHGRQRDQHRQQPAATRLRRLPEILHGHVFLLSQGHLRQT